MEENACIAHLTLGLYVEVVLQSDTGILTPSGHKCPFSASICIRSSTGNHYPEPLQLHKRLVCQHHVENDKIRHNK